MKKSIVSTLTAAIVVSAMSTTFASANPFTDVPSDHWAYDSVAELAHDGVIEGYADNTFQGDKAITRYEMAQMVAKAIARKADTNKPISSHDKVLVDRLAVEFGNELSNLGVRVSELEAKSDNVKWTGDVRYTYDNTRHDQRGLDTNTKDTNDNLELRLEPTATINNNWKAKARVTANVDVKNDNTSNNGDVKLSRIYAEGNYGNTNIKVGKIPFSVGNKLTFNYDHEFSGAQVDISNSAGLKLELGAGRFSGYSDTTDFDNDVASYQFIGVHYDKNKLDSEIAYHNLSSDYFTKIERAGSSRTDKAKILTADIKYNFNKNIGIEGNYAKNFSQDYSNKAGDAQINYKGAHFDEKGSWGTYVAYRYLGANAVIDTSYDVVSANQKGWEIGANYTLLQNTVLTAKYFNGTDINSVGTNNSAKKVFGRIQFYF